MNKRIKKKGFTLIELVIVLAVLAIIALIAIPNFNKVRTDSQKKADDATCDVIERVTQMAIADEYYASDKDTTSTIMITFNNGKVLDVTPTGGAFKAVGDETAVQIKEKYKDSLSEVNEPQQKDYNRYKVTITADDSVENVEVVLRTAP